MFHKLYQLTELLEDRPDWQRLNEGMPENYDRGIAMCFDARGGFVGCRHYRANTVFYRSGPPAGYDPSACSKLGSAPYKTIGRVGRATANLAQFVDDDDDDARVWLGRVAEELACAYDVQRALDRGKEPSAADRARIFERVSEALESADTSAEHRAYLFVAQIGADAEIAPLYDTSWAHRAVVEAFLDGCDRGTRARGTCSITGEHDRVVLGSFSELSCYNFDKQGTIAGGFNKRARPARNFPVSAPVAVALAEAIHVAQTHLSAFSYGLSYLALPAAATHEAREMLFDTLRESPERFRLSATRDLLTEEHDLIEIMLELAREGAGDHLSFALIFYEAEKASWRITGEVQQVLPSRVHAIHHARRLLESDPMLAQRDGEPFALTTGTLRRFTGEGSGHSLRLLRDWMTALFAKRSLERRPFVHRLVHTIVSTRRSMQNLARSTVLQAWALYRFALETELLAPEEPPMQPDTPASAYGAYCQVHPEFFTSQERVTAFLVGCFCATVASIQRHERGGNAPFERKFRGRLVDAALLRRLWHQGRDKLAAYDKLGVVIKTLDPDVASAFVACGDAWNESHDDTTFAFHLGLSLQYRIAQRARAQGESSEDA